MLCQRHCKFVLVSDKRKWVAFAPLFYFCEMLIQTKGKGMELLNRALPYPEQMKNIDLDKENSIYFDWRSQRYKLDLQFCRVEKSNGMLLEGDDASILMTQCLKMQLGSII